MIGMWSCGVERERGKAYLLLATARVDVLAFALCPETGDVAGEIEDGAFLGEDRRGVGCWAGHVEGADLLLARSIGLAGEVAEGEELGCAWGGHCDFVFLGCWLCEGGV
jgi:hypothetical protein